MDKETEPASKDQTEKPANKPVPSKGKNLQKNTIIYSIIAIIVFLLIGVSAFWLGSQKGDKTSEEKESTESAQIAPTVTIGLIPSPIPTSIPTTFLPSVTPTNIPPSPVPTNTPTPETKTIHSTLSLDGFQSSNGGGNDSLDVRVGRNVNLATRGFVTFDLTTIPNEAVIEKATLRLYQAKIIGNPYGVGIRIMADHLDYGSSFENSDYNTPSISSSFARLSENNNIEWKEVDATDAVRNDKDNNRPRSQFRFHLAVESIGGDVQGDFAYFESSDNSQGSGNKPQLVITYY